MKRKFELFMGCMGNGVTVCNKAVEEHGDYKQIAHISPAGNIKLYVQESYIPAPDMERIKDAAEHERYVFLRRLKQDVEANPNAAFLKMLDSLPINVYLDFLGDRSGTREDRDRNLIDLYLAYN